MLIQDKLLQENLEERDFIEWTGLLLNLVSSIMLEFLVLSLMTIDADSS